MDESDRWMDRWRERGTGCATSCLDPLVPSSVHIERHSEGHGCLWKCLCELLPGRKYLRSFAAWNLKTAGPIEQRLSSPCITLCTLLLSLYCLRRASSHFLRSFISPATFKQISLFVCERRIQVSQSCCCCCGHTVVQNYHKTDKKPRAKK